MEFIYSINHEANVIKHNNEFFTLDGEFLKGKIRDVKYYDYNTETYKTKKMWDLEPKNTKYRMKYICKDYTTECRLDRKNWRKEIKPWMK